MPLKALKLVRRCFGPPPKCLPEISGITEAKAFGNLFHSLISLTQISNRYISTQLIHYLTKRTTFFAQLSSKRTRAHV
jgi:hypothetical protein